MFDFRYVSVCWMTALLVVTEIRAGNKLFQQGFLEIFLSFFSAKQNLGSHFKSGAS